MLFDVDGCNFTSFGEKDVHALGSDACQRVLLAFTPKRAISNTQFIEDIAYVAKVANSEVSGAEGNSSRGKGYQQQRQQSGQDERGGTFQHSSCGASSSK